MYKVYLAISGAFDEMLGYVDEKGRVYRSKVGPDELVGRVDLASGKIYVERLGPDKEVGGVDLKNGKVYRSRFGPDEYIGKVDDHGRFHRHVPLGIDEHIGQIDHFISYAHAAGAMLLLVLPEHDARHSREESDSDNEEKE